MRKGFQRFLTAFRYVIQIWFYEIIYMLFHTRNETLLRIPFSVLVDVFSVGPSLAAVKMRQIDLSQAAFGMIYRFLGGFPHAFTGPKSPQWSPEEGFWKDFQN